MVREKFFQEHSDVITFYFRTAIPLNLQLERGKRSRAKLSVCEATPNPVIPNPCYLSFRIGRFAGTVGFETPNQNRIGRLVSLDNSIIRGNLAAVILQTNAISGRIKKDQWTILVDTSALRLENRGSDESTILLQGTTDVFLINYRNPPRFTIETPSTRVQI